MKKSHSRRCICLLASLIGSLATAIAGPYEPEGRLTFWTQDLAGQTGGPKLPLRVFGDEYYSRTETLSGYTVIYRIQDNQYVYAKLSEDGNELVHTEIVASAAPTPEIIARGKRIDLPPSIIFQKAASVRDSVDAARRARWKARVDANARLRTIAATRAITDADRRANSAAAPFQAAPLFPTSQTSPFTPGSIVTPDVNGIVGLTLLVQFSDVPFPATITKDKVTRFFNTGTPGVVGSSARAAIAPIPGTAGATNPSTAPARTASNTVYIEDDNAGSVFNYFYDQSGGRLNYVQAVSNIITLGTRASYNFSNAAFGEVAPDARVVGQNIVVAALASFGATPDGKRLAAALSVDSLKRVLAVNVIVAGGDSGLAMRGIWPHTGTVDSNNIGTDFEPRNVTEYSMYVLPTQKPNSPPNTEASLEPLLTIGTFCRENAKMLLGCPDLYAYPNKGVGNQCLMGTGAVGSAGSLVAAASAGSATVAFNEAIPVVPISSANGGRRPAPLNAHFKDLLGWSTVTQVSPTAGAQATVKAGVGTIPTSYPVLPTVYLPDTSTATRIYRQPGSLESFIIEVRGNGDKWAVAPTPPTLPTPPGGMTYNPLATGVLIWHIDDSKDGNASVFAGQNNGVSLEQADGLFQLENSAVTDRNHGDSGDVFTVAKPAFSDFTIPSAKWWDNTASGFRARVTSLVTTAPATATINYGDFIPPNTIIVDSPNGEETTYWKNTFSIRWRANIVGRVKIELFKGGLFQSTISASTENDKQFDWLVPNTIPVGSDYTIKISSLTNPITATVKTQVSDSSDATFLISNSDFPKFGLLPYGWVKPPESLSSWVVTTSDSVDGSFSLAAIKPRDGTSAGIQYTGDFLTGGEASFYLKVSTEAGADFARFYIDGMVQNLEGSTGLSGNVNWRKYTFNVTPGKHTFKWTYEKDSSFGGLDDRVFLDAVILPATSEEIAVKTLGANIESGAYTATLPDTTIGSTSVAQTFTIKNEGTSDLYAISLQKEGTNLADFVVSALPKTFLLAGAEMTFSVTFKPTVAGAKVATLNIMSSDASESTFSIALRGTALGLPLISVSEPTGTTAMIDGKSTRSFGSAPIGSIGSTRTFTITNRGVGQLTGLAVTKSGKANADFLIGALSSVSVAPAGTATFTVTFSPKGLKSRAAAVRILSNDVKSGPFDFKVSGTGTAAVPTITSSSSASFSMASRSLESAASVNGFDSPTTLVIGGLKYNSLAIAKGSGIVEVSSNLVDWFSGSDYTTVVSDDGTTLTVRDKTPATEAAKRYIRRK